MYELEWEEIGGAFVFKFSFIANKKNNYLNPGRESLDDSIIIFG